ncbi:MAG: tRNA dihydrouridine synthase DusB [Burkholderiales bacterium]|jgi:tRNA-dihydrouridine synthase B|nr:tRNA dihydrouridine synthase DusB [Burkholderiales bacterium]
MALELIPISENVHATSRRPTGFTLGAHSVRMGLALAPMAGFSDLPFRALCRRFGAAYTVSEMVSGQPHLRNSSKSTYRLSCDPAESPRVIQILGSTPMELAAAARFAQERGAQVVDINMGCPAKKVSRSSAGAALLGDEKNVAAMLTAVVHAVSIPVTLKFRTGLTPDHKNAVTIARIAEDAGVSLLTLHGRTRACGFSGAAEFDTVRAVRKAVSLPVMANGDIDSAEKALWVLSVTGVDAVMVGRAAVGRPWIFKEMAAALSGTRALVTDAEKKEAVLSHLDAMRDFYGEAKSVRMARKHLIAYFKTMLHHPSDDLCQSVLAAQTHEEQKDLVYECLIHQKGETRHEYFDQGARQ